MKDNSTSLVLGRKTETVEYDLAFDPTVTIAELERHYILKALAYFKGNKMQAAQALGITIKTLYNKLHEYGM